MIKAKKLLIHHYQNLLNHLNQVNRYHFRYGPSFSFLFSFSVFFWILFLTFLKVIPFTFLEEVEEVEEVII